MRLSLPLTLALAGSGSAQNFVATPKDTKLIPSQNYPGASISYKQVGALPPNSGHPTDPPPDHRLRDHPRRQVVQRLRPPPQHPPRRCARHLQCQHLLLVLPGPPRPGQCPPLHLHRRRARDHRHGRLERLPLQGPARHQHDRPQRVLVERQGQHALHRPARRHRLLLLDPHQRHRQPGADRPRHPARPRRGPLPVRPDQRHHRRRHHLSARPQPDGHDDHAGRAHHVALCPDLVPRVCRAQDVEPRHQHLDRVVRRLLCPGHLCPL